MKMEGDYGLVWDGAELNCCAGTVGEYLKYNNPHKVSLYIASEMPIIIWEKAALAKFVKDNNIGITVSSLYELPEVLSKVTKQEYQMYKYNLSRLSADVKNGKYLTEALSKYDFYKIMAGVKMKTDNNQKIKIIVASHKKYRMPEEDMYVPVQVGANGRKDIGMLRDDSGDNISEKNPNYCELTGLYWAWKNETYDVLGMVHYRRFFVEKKKKNKWGAIATRKQIQKRLNKSDIILPKKRNYFIETNYSQYCHAHNAIDLDTTRVIIEEKYPEYLPEFDRQMKKTKGHKFNMFIMKRYAVDEYCEWLFDILFELEKRLDISNYSLKDSRVFGYVSERLLDVWLYTKGYSYTEMPVLFMENQHFIKKITKFMLRKFNIKCE